MQPRLTDLGTTALPSDDVFALRMPLHRWMTARPKAPLAGRTAARTLWVRRVRRDPLPVRIDRVILFTPLFARPLVFPSALADRDARPLRARLRRRRRLHRNDMACDAVGKFRAHSISSWRSPRPTNSRIRRNSLGAHGHHCAAAASLRRVVPLRRRGRWVLRRVRSMIFAQVRGQTMLPTGAAPTSMRFPFRRRRGRSGGETFHLLRGETYSLQNRRAHGEPPLRSSSIFCLTTGSRARSPTMLPPAFAVP